MSKQMNYESRTIEYKNSATNYTTCIFHQVMMKDFSQFRDLIDINLVQIVEGESDYVLRSTKTEKQKRGAVAELLAHVFLRQIGFTQECIFNNLEEGSLKKGFDGLYLNSELFWLVEIKSTYTQGVIHRDRLKSAISDLNDKIEGRTTNNPFRNAVHHVKAVREKYNLNLLKVIRKLSKDYSEGIFYSLSDFNIIPISTLYVEHRQSIDDIAADISKLLTGSDFKDILAICIDNNIFQDFISYLKE